MRYISYVYVYIRVYKIPDRREREKKIGRGIILLILREGIGNKFSLDNTVY